jgi:hypothetical protein
MNTALANAKRIVSTHPKTTVVVSALMVATAAVIIAKPSLIAKLQLDDATTVTK